LERQLRSVIDMDLFPSEGRPGSYQAKARSDLRRVCLELAVEREHAEALRRLAASRPGLAFKAEAAEVLVAALKARAAQLRRAAGRPAAAA
jgi:hypothetical protein